MRYYVLNTPAGDEVARLSSRGTASYFETTTRRWIPDPLLAVEVASSADWREVEPYELPTAVADHVDENPRVRKFRVLRRGRHSRE
jgi:hypothetical protein